MTTPSWISTLMPPTAWPWKAISIKEPATPLRPGAGPSLALFPFSCLERAFFPLMLLSFSRRWFSIQKNQLVYQKKFKVCFKCHEQTNKWNKHFFTPPLPRGFRSSRQWWWRTCGSAPSKTALKTSGASVLRWSPRQSECVHKCIFYCLVQ